MKFSVFLAAFLLYLPASMLQAETKIYFWVDKDGKSHFSDTAAAGTEQIVIENKNLISTNSVKPARKKLSEVNDLSLQEKKIIDYQAEITSPQDDTPIRSNDGSLNIHVKTTPEGDNSLRLQLFLDGQALGSPQMSPSIRAFNVDRGTHQIQVHVLDESARTVAKTQIVTIHLLRATLK